MLCGIYILKTSLYALIYHFCDYYLYQTVESLMVITVVESSRNQDGEGIRNLAGKRFHQLLGIILLV